jgi:hypothetical protein
MANFEPAPLIQTITDVAAMIVILSLGFSARQRSRPGSCVAIIDMP